MNCGEDDSPKPYPYPKPEKADVEIDCHEPAHFFRGLNWVLNHLEKAEGEKASENPCEYVASVFRRNS